LIFDKDKIWFLIEIEFNILLKKSFDFYKFWFWIKM